MRRRSGKPWAGARPPASWSGAWGLTVPKDGALGAKGKQRVGGPTCSIRTVERHSRVKDRPETGRRPPRSCQLLTYLPM